MFAVLRRLTCVAALVFAASPALAQAWPDKPITVVVPFAAGGPTDTVARLLGQSMSATLGQQIVVENVAGAGGTTGAARVAKATPDGYTLLLHHVALAAGPGMYRLGYDTLTAFQPVGLVNYGPYVLTSRSGFPAGSPAALLAKIKAEGASINMAHAGLGSGSHLCGLMLTQALGAQIAYVPYRGTGPAMNDLVGGQVDLLCDQTTNAIPQIEAGKIKAYAVTSTARLAQLPDLPTLDELGMKGVEITVWHALYAPAGTPRPVVDRLHAALQTALADPTIRQRFTDLGTLVFPAERRSPEALASHLRAEVERWGAAIRAAGLKPE